MAQNNLGYCYANGEGVPKDQVEAVRWYRAAADRGFAKAQHNLGLRYATGKGGGKDDREAARWYRAAADQGLAEAQHNLAVAYANGAGVPKDEVRSRPFRIARQLRRGVAEAQNDLECGIGVRYQASTRMLPSPFVGIEPQPNRGLPTPNGTLESHTRPATGGDAGRRRYCLVVSCTHDGRSGIQWPR